MTTSLKSLGRRAREAAIDDAIAALERGELVLASTETVYGVFADARDAGAVARLRSGNSDRLPAAWHARGLDEARERLGPLRGGASRAMERLAPGPVTFIVEVGEDRAKQAAASLGAVAGAVAGDGVVVVRVPEAGAGADLIARAGFPVVGRGVAAFGLGEGKELPRLSEERWGELGVGAVLEDGPTKYGKGSTLIRLDRGGGVRIEREGAIPARRVWAILARRLLFVCSGNTCRSPMAASIARALAGEAFEVESAGVSAMEGAGMTAEAGEALRALGMEPGVHASSMLTRERVASAEAVFVMTKAHLRAVESMGGSGKAVLLDPEGGDVEDPIGGPLEAYIATAKRLREMIEVRLKEFGA